MKSEKRWIRKGATAAAAILLLAGAYLLLRPAPPRFQRLEVAATTDPALFRIDRATSRVSFLKAAEEIPLDGIANSDGTGILLKGRHIVHLEPALRGETSFYFHLFFESLSKPKKIRFTLLQQRKKGNRELQRIETERVSTPLIVPARLERGEKILLVFEGNGIVFFSRPIQYRPVRPEKRRLLILVGVDTLRADRIGRSVNGRSLTPAIDRLRSEGVSFDHAFSQSSWTIPSFVSLFTGLYEHHHGVSIGSSLDLDRPNLVESLARDFLCFGIHGGLGLDGRWGYSRGFDYYQELVQTGPLYPRGGESLFQKALEFIQKGGFPDLFLFLHTYQVHAPYTPPPEYLKRLSPPPSAPSLDVVNSAKPERTFVPVPDEMRRSFEALYDAEVMAFDDFFGAFISRLKKLGLYERAMIVLLGDHGEEFFEHGGWAHSHSLYDELVRVPLIIKFPGGHDAGLRPGAAVGLIDVLPTLLDYYRIPPPARGHDGISLLPIIRGKSPQRTLFSSISVSRYIEAIPPKFALVQWPRKLIVNYPYSPADLAFFSGSSLPPQVPEYELFDLAADPSERHNLAAADPSAVARWMPLVVKMKKFLRELATRVGKPGLLDSDVFKKLKSLGYI